ncbi:dynamin family protein [Segatella copri]|uniref:dynamin family protein n=1 Tax=Segatella TaxID=2974251 RepID=UPI00222EC6D6|nr:dynamin family protein [Segatella copri]MCW4080711.1 dynamin family protein [Segatella copri]MCW4105977.1 dynamin family protein [Segatella copri]
MTEWIVLLVGVIIALAIGFFLGRQKGTAATVEDDTKNLVEENKQLKDKYSAVCSKLKDTEAGLENVQKTKDIESKYKELLSEAKAECKKLDEQLKNAISGNCDETVKAQLDEVVKLKKRITDLEDEIEDNEDDIDNYKKKLKKKDSELSELQENYDKECKASKQMGEELGLVKRELDGKTEELKLKMGSLEFIQEILSAQQTKADSSVQLYKNINFLESVIRGQVLDCYEMAWAEKGIQVGTSNYNKKKEVLMSSFFHWAAMKKKHWLDGKTTIAFVGEFSAGKTSIVNRILSQDDKTIPLLPVSTKATTAIPTYIAGGVSTAYRFVTPDNVEKNLSESTFKKVSKEVLDQVKGVSSLIKYFVMTYKNPNLDGLSILDTPGFNSNDSEDKERTIEVINECDALFWVFDVNAGTVNRSSISLIKEKLNKPLYVVINKVDTKPKSEVDKVEALISKTLKDAGLKVEQYIRFSAKAPLEDIMAPIKSVGSTSESDTFVEDVQTDLEGLSKKYESTVQDASRKYDGHTKAYNKQIEKVNRCLTAICDNCVEAEDIPQWKKHTFSKDRYEMSRDEGERLIAILSDIAGEQTDDLISAFQTLQKMQSEMDKAHACLIECKKQFVQVQKCLESYNNETKKFK